MARHTEITRWILPYESPWGIIGKFCYFNPVSLKTILCLLDSTNEIKYKSIGIKKWDFNNAYLFSEENLKKLAAIANFEKHQLVSVIKEKDLHWLVSTRHLRFCKECVAKGYHSIFHQMLLLKNCVIHKEVALTDFCLFCGRSIPYQLNLCKSQGYACPMCLKHFWSHIISQEGKLKDNLLSIDEHIIGELDYLFNWFKAVKAKPIFTPVLERDFDHFDVSYFGAIDMLKIWSDLIPYKDDLMMKHHSMHHQKVKFGSLSTDLLTKICEKSSSRDIENCPEQLIRAKHLSYKAYQIRHRLPAIYKSIKRHLWKIHTISARVHCKLPRTRPKLLDFTEMCYECKWGRAFSLWRSAWEKDWYFDWEKPYLEVRGINNIFASNWALCWILSLECIWTFYHTLLTMCKSETTVIHHEDIIRGRYAFYWSIDISASSEKPVFHYWTNKCVLDQVIYNIHMCK